MNYQKIVLAGNATENGQRRKAKRGDMTYATFSVAVGDSKEHTTFFPITVFGEYGETVAKYVTKGRQVLVDGRIRVGNKGRFNVIADRVQLGAEAKAAEISK